MSSTHDQSFPENSDLGKSRVSKACARCRLKKQRCSGGTPCSNCKLADAVCHFGSFKRTQRKMFPEHYVRALEAQQHKLETAVHTMYYRLLAANAWPGPKLIEHGSNPLIHDVLAGLGLLDTTREDRTRHNHDQPEPGEHEVDLAGNDTSIVESPEQQYQERPDPLPTQPQRIFPSPGETNHFSPLVPEETRWFGGIPELLSRSATAAHSLTAPRRLDFVPAVTSLGRSNIQAGSSQPQAQSLPSSFSQQQLFVAAGSSQNAGSNSTVPEAMNWDLFDKSTAWWYGDLEDAGQQPSLVGTNGSVNSEGPCELDGLWQSTQAEVAPQATPADDETRMDRELPEHFFRIGW